ncbi:MAG TPA: pitrilysin family protein [Jatrophihabitans sp.]|nr:pitrilysin family protein [Jatrophihabitans sp.]
MTTTTHAPRPGYAATSALERHRLDNGLQVLIATDPALGAVGVCVDYNVGYRSEPSDRTGFAHLFEHMMFQGSASVGKLEHANTVQESGGSFNGTTQRDHTSYYEVVPTEALDRMLFLEADRMAGVAITEENLANQVAVVKAEIRSQLLNRPYAGLPWIDLPPVLFDRFENAHNGYGDFEHLEQVTTADCAAFFADYYAPGNALLTICGDVDPARTLASVRRYFDAVPPRATPARAVLAEPAPAASRVQERPDPLIPLPALCSGRRVPDPEAEFDAYLHTVLAAMVLGDGPTSRLSRRLVRDTGLATHAGAAVGMSGKPFEARDPDAFVVTVFQPPGRTAEAALGAVADELERLALDGPSAAELARAKARYTSTVHRGMGSAGGRARALGTFELLYGRAESALRLAEHIEAIEGRDVSRAAAALSAQPSATLLLVPGRGAA